MAEPNYTIPDWPLKRLRFFDRQFLQSKDFIDDQAFHIAMRYRDNKPSACPECWRAWG